MEHGGDTPLGDASGAFERLQVLFAEALACEPEEREACLARVGAGDDTLLRRLRGLLRAHARAEGLLDQPPFALAADPPSRFVGRRVGRYKLVRLVATGGMGAVYEAEQEHPRRMVAIKLMRPGAASRSLLRRFELEAQVLGRLQHVGIAQIFEAGTDDLGDGEQPYLAMEFIRGDPLLHWADRWGLDDRARLELLARLGDAVQHAHDMGVVHRDLKPANLLVDESGQPKVLDFGVARALDRGVTVDARQTREGQLVGTLAYMSPEQVSGDPGAVDARSDVYALGVIAYELLGGRAPLALDGLALPDAVAAITEREPPRLGRVHRRLQGDVETIVAKALEKSAERRYASAADFAADIRRHLAERPILARPPTTIYQLAKFARRHRALVGGAVSVVVVIVAATLVSLDRALSEQEARERADRGVEQVRDMARVVMFDVYDALLRLEGGHEAREQLAATARRALDSLAEDVDDPDLLLDLAAASLRLGDVRSEVDAVNTGDVAGAARDYERAVELLLRRLAVRPADDGTRVQLAIALTRAGDLTGLRGRGDLARADYRWAGALCTDVLARRPGSTEARSTLTSCHDKLARSLATEGRRTEARTHLELALAAGEARVADAPGDAAARADLAAVLSHAQDLELGSGDVVRRAPAAALGERARCLLNRLAEEQPGNVQHKRHLAVLEMLAGDLAAAEGDAGRALTRYEAMESAVRALLEVEPRDATAWRDLSVAHDKIGRVLASVRDLRGALARYVSARDLRLDRMDAESGLAQAQRDLAVSHYQVATVREGLAAGADLSHDERVRLLEEAAADFASCLELNEEMRARGTLRASDAPVFDILRRRIDGCRQQVAELVAVR